MGDIQSVIRQFRKDMLALEQEATDAIERHYAAMLPKVQADLDILISRMERDIAAEGKGLSPSWLYEQNRLNHLQGIIKAQVDYYAQVAHGSITQSIGKAAQEGVRAASGILDSTVPRGITYAFGVPSPDAVHAAIGALQPDSALQQLFAGWGKDTATRSGQALVYGVMSGRNPKDVAKDIQGLLGVNRNRALVIARTEMMRAYRTGSLENYRANSDVVSSWRWTCSFSDRTCIACLDEDGSIHDLDEEMSSHNMCRCTMVPITRSYNDILSDAGIEGAAIQEVASPDTWQTGQEWFTEQDAATQRQILGPSAYNAYDRGDVTLDDFLGHAQSAEWGASIYTKSLKELGLDAADYSD